MTFSRRNFLKTASAVAASAVLPEVITHGVTVAQERDSQAQVQPDYTIRIAASPIEIAKNKIISGRALESSFHVREGVAASTFVSPAQHTT